MKKIQAKEGWEKIKNGLKDKTTHYNAAYHEKKEKQKKEKMEKMFEQEFLQPQTEEQEPISSIEVPKPSTKINIKIDNYNEGEQQM